MFRSKMIPALLCIGLGSVGGAHASSVSYFMNQSNALPDGQNYLKVTIDDNTVGYINFAVDVLPSLSAMASSNFGIQEFGFNVVPSGTLPPDSSSQPSVWTLPTGWKAESAPPPNQLDGFGRFDVSVSATGSNRLSALQFSFQSNQTLASYLDLSTNNAAQGNAYFAAHVSDFKNGAIVTSGYFSTNALTPVPVPAALILLASALVPLVSLRKRQK